MTTREYLATPTEGIGSAGGPETPFITLPNYTATQYYCDAVACFLLNDCPLSAASAACGTLLDAYFEHLERKQVAAEEGDPYCQSPSAPRSDSSRDARVAAPIPWAITGKKCVISVVDAIREAGLLKSCEITLNIGTLAVLPYKCANAMVHWSLVAPLLEGHYIRVLLPGFLRRTALLRCIGIHGNPSPRDLELFEANRSAAEAMRMCLKRYAVRMLAVLLVDELKEHFDAGRQRRGPVAVEGHDYAALPTARENVRANKPRRRRSRRGRVARAVFHLLATACGCFAGRWITRSSVGEHWAGLTAGCLATVFAQTRLFPRF